ncbi:MAG: hypothetical protein PGN11_21585, partial [Quadrisphaera sp.]
MPADDRSDHARDAPAARRHRRLGPSRGRRPADDGSTCVGLDVLPEAGPEVVQHLPGGAGAARLA